MILGICSVLNITYIIYSFCCYINLYIYINYGIDKKIYEQYKMKKYSDLKASNWIDKEELCCFIRK